MITDILEDHLDDAASLFDRTLSARRMLDFSVQDVRDLQRRLDASLDGLRVGGESTWAIARPYLMEDDAGYAFAASICAWELGGDEGRQTLIATMSVAGEEQAKGIRGGLIQTHGEEVESFLREAVAGTSPAARAISLGALVDLGIDPGAGVVREGLSSSPGPWLLAAIEAAGVSGSAAHRKAVEAWAASGDPDVTPVALVSLARLDPQVAWKYCREILGGAMEDIAPAIVARACRVAGVVGGADSVELLELALELSDHDVQREALLAVGNQGRLRGVPVLLAASRNPSLNGIAVVALQRVLGEMSDVATASDESSDDEEADGWDPDNDLPRREPEAVASWCSERTSDLPDEVRLRGGVTLGTETAPSEPGAVPAFYSYLESLECLPDKRPTP